MTRIIIIIIIIWGFNSWFAPDRSMGATLCSGAEQGMEGMHSVPVTKAYWV